MASGRAAILVWPVGGRPYWYGQWEGGHIGMASGRAAILVCPETLCAENAKSPETYQQRYEAMRALLDQTKDIAATLQPKDKEEVLKLVSELDALNEELRRLEESGEVSDDAVGSACRAV